MLTTLVLFFSAASATPLRADHASLAYHGDFISHPGIDGRLDWRITDSGRLTLALEAESGSFWHPHNIVAIYARTGPAVRLESSSGARLGAFVHAGVQHGFLAAPTYMVEDGRVIRKRLAGESWLTVTSGLELGHTLSHTALDGWFVRPQLGLRFPSFYGYGLDLAVSAGISF